MTANRRPSSHAGSGTRLRAAGATPPFPALEIGQRIRRLRTQRGLSQRALADFAGRSDRWLWNVEAGLTTLDITELEDLAVGLRVDVAVVLGLEDTVMKRRELLLAGLGAAGIAIGLAHAPTRRSLEHLAQVTAQFGSWSLRMPPDLMAPLLEAHQSNLATLLRHSPPGPRTQLLLLAADTAILRGEVWCAQGNRSAARGHFRAAEQMAREAGDGPRLAAVYRAQRHVVSLAYIRSGNRADARRAVELLVAAEHEAGPSAPPEQRTSLYATTAEELASEGLGTKSMRYLDRADRALAQAGKPPLGPYDHWDQARLDGWRASCLLYLDRPQEAVPLLERAAAETPEELVSCRVAVQSDLSAAYARSGEVERCVDLLMESLAAGRRSGLQDHGDARVRSIRDGYLAAYATTPAVRQLDEALAS